MDCQTFDARLIDALYEESDGGDATDLHAHARGCDACAGRLERLAKTRELVSAALDAPFPAGLEDRIVAAADAARGTAVAAAQAPAAPEHRGEGFGDVKSPGGRLIAFLARPQLALAAAFLLVLGAGAFVTLGTSAKRAAPASAPGAVAQDNAPAPLAATQPAAEADGDQAEGAKTKTAAVGRAAPAASHASLAEAQQLHDTGRCAEALARLEPITASSPQAELLAARCLAQTKGCAAALPRFEDAARRAPGTETGSHAALEAARCLRKEGQLAAARTRYAHLSSDNYVSEAANAELAALEPAKASTTPVRAAKPAVKAGPQATATSNARPPNAAGY